ncbi:MAG: DNA repair protein RecO [Tannerella sp.]|jgi:DNA repair protein RecO (recombination protein O)|nr:DNA repair protein RecO [Tannerella sp.]
MLSKTRGIVLHAQPYNDNYSIVHVYTEFFGRVAYLVARRRKGKTMVPHALFLPLSVVEMEVEHLNTRDIQRIREMKACYPLTTIPTHPVKNIIVLFLAEILYRAVHTKEPDARLFEYLYESIRWLELSDEGVANFHLVFLIHLVHYLGVYPNVESYRPGGYFDMMNGIFTGVPPEHRHYLDETESIVFYRLLRMNYANMAVYAFSRHERSRIICRILEYYRLHLPDFPEIKSFAILQSLFD